MLRLFVRAFGGAGIGADSFLGVDLGFERLFLAVDLLVEGFVVGNGVANVLDLVVFQLLDNLVQG